LLAVWRGKAHQGAITHISVDEEWSHTAPQALIWARPQGKRWEELHVCLYFSFLRTTVYLSRASFKIHPSIDSVTSLQVPSHIFTPKGRIQFQKGMKLHASWKNSIHHTIEHLHTIGLFLSPSVIESLLRRRKISKIRTDLKRNIEKYYITWIQYCVTW
jgi:hypothetical protein